MKVRDFNSIYENAKITNVQNDDWFNGNVWFWLQLTEKQVTKMFELMKSQGATTQESDREEFKHFIQLKIGLKIYQ